MPNLGPVTHLTVHCAATPEGRAVTYDQINAWDKAKFGQISYHYVIELDGKITRTLRDDQLGAHTGGHNTGNIGVCYIGGVCADNATPKDTRTDAQKKSLREVIKLYQTRYPGIQVLGHRDWPNVQKACPSFDCRASVAAGMPD